MISHVKLNALAVVLFPILAMIGCIAKEPLSADSLSAPLANQYALPEVTVLPETEGDRIAVALAGIRAQGSLIAIDVYMAGRDKYLHDVVRSISLTVADAPDTFFEASARASNQSMLTPISRDKGNAGKFVTYRANPPVNVSSDGARAVVVSTFVYRMKHPVSKGDNVVIKLTDKWRTSLYNGSVFVPNTSVNTITVSE
jgi:hypothetical protein